MWDGFFLVTGSGTGSVQTLQAHHRLWTSDLNPLDDTSVAAWVMEIGKWQRPSTGDRTPPVRQHWGHFMHFSVSCRIRLTVDVVKKSASTDFILTLLNRSIETPKFRFHVQLPAHQTHIGNKVCWPQRENVGLLGQNKTHKTSQSRSYLAWPAWEEASTFASLKKCSL